MFRILRSISMLVLVLVCVGLIPESVEAKKKRLKDRILKEAVKLGKDREKKLAGEKAMPNGVFQENWTTFVDHLDQNYLGHDVSLKKFGTDVRFRKGFAHLMYVSLRSETQGLELVPSAQSVVGKYPFLQELMLQGSCYTGGDPFPKKVSDLLGANPGIPFLLAEHLDSWDKKYQKEFKKAYPKTN